jgi:hypothetical protein
MAREDTTLTRLVVTASILLNAVLLAVVGAMAASDHAAAKIAPRLHLAHEQQLEGIRREGRATRTLARGAQRQATVMLEFIEDVREEIETSMVDLGGEVINQNLVVEDLRRSVEEAQNFTSLQDVDSRVSDVQERLIRLEERLAALCARRGC